MFIHLTTFEGNSNVHNYVEHFGGQKQRFLLKNVATLFPPRK
jgi:hypothetical protein